MPGTGTNTDIDTGSDVPLHLTVSTPLSATSLVVSLSNSWYVWVSELYSILTHVTCNLHAW